MSTFPDSHAIPTLGQHFASFDELVRVLRNCSVMEKFQYRVAKKDTTRGIYICAVSGCPWRVRANRTDLGYIAHREMPEAVRRWRTLGVGAKSSRTARTARTEA